MNKPQSTFPANPPSQKLGDYPSQQLGVYRQNLGRTDVSRQLADEHSQDQHFDEERHT
jgi:hypothetical protein